MLSWTLTWGLHHVGAEGFKLWRAGNFRLSDSKSSACAPGIEQAHRVSLTSLAQKAAHSVNTKPAVSAKERQKAPEQQDLSLPNYPPFSSFPTQTTWFLARHAVTSSFLYPVQVLSSMPYRLGLLGSESPTSPQMWLWYLQKM